MRTQTVNFTLAVNYHLLTNSIPVVDMARDIEDALLHVKGKHALDAPNSYHANTLEVKAVADNYTSEECDTALCVFDELLGAYLCKGEKPSALTEAVTELHNIGGVTKLREISMDLAKQISLAWNTNSDFTSKYEDCFDLDFIPELMARAVEELDFPDVSADAWGRLTLDIVAPEDKATFLRGLFVYNEQLYKTPFEAQEAGALANVEGYEQTPTVGELATVMNSISKSFLHAGSSFKPVYVYDSQYSGFLGDGEPHLTVDQYFKD